MATLIDLKCEKCGAAATLKVDLNVSTISTGGKIQSDNACPSCGAAALTAPAGFYTRHEDGRLVRTGDYPGQGRIDVPPFGAA